MGTGLFGNSRQAAPAIMKDSVWGKLSMVNSLFAKSANQSVEVGGGGGSQRAPEPPLQATLLPSSDLVHQEEQKRANVSLLSNPQLAEAGNSQETTREDGYESDDGSEKSRVLLGFSGFSTAATAEPSDSPPSAAAALSSGVSTGGSWPVAAVSSPIKLKMGSIEAPSAGGEDFIDSATLSRLLAARLITKTFLTQSFTPLEIKEIRAILCGPTLHKNTLKANNISDIVSACPATDPKTFVAALRKAACPSTAPPTSLETSLPLDSGISQSANLDLPPPKLVVPTMAVQSEASSLAPSFNPSSLAPSSIPPVSYEKLLQSAGAQVAVVQGGLQGVRDTGARSRALWSDAQWHDHLLKRLKRDKVSRNVKRLVQSDSGDSGAGAGKRAKIAAA